MTARSIYRTILVAAGALLAGCRPAYRAAATDVGPGTWEETAEVVLRNDDTLSTCGMGLFLRLNDRFEGDTLSLRIRYLSPDSLAYEERIDLALPRPAHPAPLAPVLRIPLRRDVRLLRSGDYRIRLTPSHPVRGVDAVGVDLKPEE